MCDDKCKLINLWFYKNYIEKDIYLYLKIPSTFEEYWNSIKNVVRTDYRKAIKNGYCIKQLDIMDETKFQQLLSIWSSWDEKQHRSINYGYEYVDGTKKDLRGGWPYRSYSLTFKCDKHNIQLFCCYKNNVIVGYLELLQYDNFLVVHSTMAHKDHIKNGIVKLLFIDVIKHNIGKTRFYYGDVDFLKDQRRHFVLDLNIKER